MSVVLYVAIIAIWLFVLVPRWLRRAHEPQGAPAEQPDSYSGPQDQDDDGAQYEFGAEYQSAVQYQSSADYESATGYQSGAEYLTSAEYQSDSEYQSDGEYRSGAGGGGAARPGPPRSRADFAPVRRTRVLQARRRLLTILVLLTAVAGTCVALKLTSWWVCVPPAVMLTMYVLLLREARVADAQQARRRAAAEARFLAARRREHELQVEEEAQYSAQIIDISARVGDQLYDQYADATNRAVGD